MNLHDWAMTARDLLYAIAFGSFFIAWLIYRHWPKYRQGCQECADAQRAEKEEERRRSEEYARSRGITWWEDKDDHDKR